MNINTAAVLPSGWHYFDKAGQYRIPHKSELPNPKAVVDAIMQYRLENSIPVGDPEGDFEEYVCTNFPTWCRREGACPQPVQIVPGSRNVDLVIGWANQLYTMVGRLSLVPQKEAEERANICVNCPMQMDWVNDCPPCVSSAQRVLMILRQGKDTISGQNVQLKGCAAHGWDNRTACHLDRQHLPNEANPNAPANCWVRNK